MDLAPECVTVSLDGGEDSVHDKIRGVKGSFERATHAIERYVGLGLPTSVITTVHKMNLKELTKIREFLKGKGVAWHSDGHTTWKTGTKAGLISRGILLSCLVHCCNEKTVFQ